jgi:hypothetical protein
MQSLEEDANGVEYKGFRASLAQDLSDEWSANLVLAHQTVDADGVFFADPTLGDRRDSHIHCK